MKEITGNYWIHAKDYEALVVTTNCVIKKDDKLVMGAGIAKQFADRFPLLQAKLGQLVLANGRQVELVTGSLNGYNSMAKKILALPTKNHFKDKSNFDEVLALCKQLEEIVTRNGIKTILATQPGCSLGGLEWSKVKPRLNQIWDDRFTIISPDPRTQRNIDKNYL